MPYILGRHRVDDVEAWKKMIEAHKPGHREAGIHFQQVWVNEDDPREIFFLFKADDLNRARSFLEAAGALNREKQSRGEIPHLFFLEER
jgi:hypothetical protein